MKKILSILVLCLLVLSVSACGSKKDESSDNDKKTMEQDSVKDYTFKTSDTELVFESDISKMYFTFENKKIIAAKMVYIYDTEEIAKQYLDVLKNANSEYIKNVTSEGKKVTIEYNDLFVETNYSNITSDTLIETLSQAGYKQVK